MKKIMGNLIYDTDKAEKVFSFRRRREVGSIGNLNICEWFEVDVYKTKKGNYFIHGYVEDKPSYENFIEEFSEKELLEIVKKLNPDKYIELCYDELEEA